MDYPALKSLIDSEAKNATRTDEEVAAWCAEFVTVRRPVATAEVRRYVTEATLWGPVERLATDATSDFRDAAKSALQALGPQAFETIDMDRAQVVGLMDALVAGGAIADADKDALLALGDHQIPRWQAAGVQISPSLSVGPAHVAIARTL